MRPKYHISPEQGFLNDPNGLAQFRGKYHVFYQWLPDVVPQGSKQWRHCISNDLVHWTDEGSALQPDEWYEKMVAIQAQVLQQKISIFCSIQVM